MSSERRRGPKPRLSREAVIDEALVLLREGGLPVVSIRGIAARLDIVPTGIYRYFENKGALLDAMAVRVMTLDAPPAAPGETWADRVRAVMLGVFEALADHDGVADILYTRTETDQLDDLRERLFGLLHDAGFDAQQTVDGLSAILTYVVGAARREATVRREHPATAADRLRRLPADRFPALTSIADEYPNRSSQRAFEFGLDLLLDGLEAHRLKRG